MEQATASFKSWAIDLNVDDKHSLAGRNHFTWCGSPAPSTEGNMVAMFKTRAIARQFRRDIRNVTTPHPLIVRISVEVKTIEDEEAKAKKDKKAKEKNDAKQTTTTAPDAQVQGDVPR